MKKVPYEEKDLIKVGIYWSMTEKVAVEHTIIPSDIKHCALRLIYEGKTDEAEAELANQSRDKNWQNDF